MSANANLEHPLSSMTIDLIIREAKVLAARNEDNACGDMLYELVSRIEGASHPEALLISGMYQALKDNEVSTKCRDCGVAKTSLGEITNA